MTSNRQGAQLRSLTDRLSIARSRLDELEMTAPRIAHDAALGDEEARAGFQEVQKDIDKLRAEVDLLTKAIAYENEQVNRKATARRRAEQAAIIERGMKKARKLFEDDFPELQRRLAPAIEQYKKILKSSADVLAALPLRQPIRAGLLLSAREIHLAVNYEIARLDAVAISSAQDMYRVFPRANGIGVAALQHPESIQNLSERLEEALGMLENELNTKSVFPAAVDGSGEMPAAAAVGHGAAAAGATTAKRTAAEIQIEMQAESDWRDATLPAEGL